MSLPRMGPFAKIVNVNWGGGYYVLFQLLVDNNTAPNVSITLGKNAKLAYERKETYTRGAGSTTINVVWLPAQSLDIHDENPTFQPVPCHGTFEYWTGSTSIPLGYVDVNTAWANAAVYNQLGGWFNSSPLHASSKDSAFSSAPGDIVAFGGPFASFTPGLAFTPATAAAFAAALASMSTAYGGWANGPVPTAPGTPPCDDITGPQPHAPDEFSTWSVGTITTTDPGTTFLEYVALIEVSGTPSAGGDPVFTANMTSGAGWNTFVNSYKKKDHKVSPSNAGPNPYGLTDGKVWYPIIPYTDQISQIFIDGGGTQTVHIDKSGNLF